MSEKLLFISEMDFKIKSGGSVISQDDLNTLKKHFDVEIVNYHVSNRAPIKKIIDLILSPISIFYNRKTIAKIKNKIKSSDAKIVFFNNSIFGYLVKYARKLGKKTIVRFQNCEIKLAKDCKRFLYYFNIYMNEKKTLNNSNYCVFFNNRDYADIKKYYRIKKINYHIIPPGIQDEYTNEITLTNKASEPYGLFIGSYFKPNLEAIDFLYKHIKNIPGKIKIIGYNLESYAPKYTNEKIELIGTVNNIAPYIINAAYMIYPIFSGSGMKIKTSQALMFGKEIFGTQEAFEGYTILPNMHVCKSKEDFEIDITKFLSCNFEYYNESARDFWLKNYSSHACEFKLVNLINKLTKERV